MSKRGFCVFLIIPLLIFSCKKKEQPKPELFPITPVGTWKRLHDFPDGDRAMPLVFTIAGKAYIIAGRKDSVYLKDVWEYDPNLDTWTKKADYPGIANMGLAGFEINGKGYVGTGLKPDSSVYLHKDFYEYDPIKDTWTRKTDFPGIGRWGATGFSINGIGYLGLGAHIDIYLSPFSDIWKYEVSTDQWSSIAVLPTYADGAGYTCNGKEYVGLTNFSEYDPALNKWTPKAAFPSDPRVGTAQFVIGTNIYVGLGSVHYVKGQSDLIDYIASDMWQYNTLTDKWHRISNFPNGAKTYPISFSIGGAGYVGMAEGGTDMWKFTP